MQKVIIPTVCSLIIVNYFFLNFFRIYKGHKTIFVL